MALVEAKPRKSGISARDILTGTLNIMADDGLITVTKGRYSLTERGHLARKAA